MVKLVSLSSGSCGNAVYVEAGRTKLLIDAGVPISYLGQALRRLGVRLADLTAVLITHEHSDHIHGAAALSRRFRLPLMANLATIDAAARHVMSANLTAFPVGEPFTVGDFDVQAVPLAHDAKAAVGFVFRYGRHKIGVATDLGCVTENVFDALSDADALIFESNHDRVMLARGRYPEPLKRRIAGSFGHLSNEAAAGALLRLVTGRRQAVLLAHLSQENNRPELALATVAATLKREGIDSVRLGVAGRLRPSPIIALQ